MSSACSQRVVTPFGTHLLERQFAAGVMSESQPLHPPLVILEHKASLERVFGIHERCCGIHGCSGVGALLYSSFKRYGHLPQECQVVMTQPRILEAQSAVLDATDKDESGCTGAGSSFVYVGAIAGGRTQASLRLWRYFHPSLC